MIKRSILLLYTIPLWAIAAENNTTQNEMIDRIKPIGGVHVQEEPHTTSTITSSPQTSKAPLPSGKTIYDQYCRVCHQTGLAGAPRYQNKDDWQSRMTGKTLDELVTIAKKGINAMPAKGTCMQCTTSDIKAAIEYMVPPHE